MAQHRIFRALSVAALLGFHQLSAVASDYPWAATCVETKGFHDGDTLKCVSASSDKGTFVVRFANIDAPETGQAFWKASRDLLRELANPGTRAECYKRDDFGREVCRLKSPTGEDIADSMLQQGMAWHAVRYVHEQTATERTRYSALEAEARSSKRGLWADPSPQAPWDCRQLKRKRQRCS